MPDFEKRRDKVRHRIRNAADAILVTNHLNVTYLTGFTGEDSFLLINRDHEMLISDGRFTIQLGEECPGLEVDIRKPGTTVVDRVGSVARKLRLTSLAIESESMTVAQRRRLEDSLPKVALRDTEGVVEGLRMIKDKHEIDATRSAVRVAERAFTVIRAGLRPGQTEKEVADALDHQIRLFGGRCCSFPPIVAVGPRSALPHAVPGPRRIGDDDFTLFDWGADHRLYMSDLTRLVVTGRISRQLRKVYGVVLEAHQRAIAVIRPNAAMHDVDRAARETIAAAGHDKHFRHSVGHGVGLEIHEAPRLAPGQQGLLKAGMIVTVEPGIYLPGWGGIRIEDDVLVTRSGHEVLSSVPTALEECVISV